MHDVCAYARRPLAFLFRYMRRHPLAHVAILIAVLAAVGCSVGTQYGVKFLVDTLSKADPHSGAVWVAFALLAGLIAGDMLMWRVGGWIAAHTFVAVTGDVRQDLFRHLTGHAPSFFTDRLPGTLASRITAASNAIFTIESMGMWNVLPPCAATAGAIALLATVSTTMTLSLAALAALLIVLMFRLAKAGGPLHHRFARRAAAVDGEMVDVVGNMQLVRVFGGIEREHRRFQRTVGREMSARRRSLIYLEKLRLLHAGITVALSFGLMAWAILLWQAGQASTGDVVLVVAAGFTILHATRDLAVALVDVTQHMSRLAEAVATLLVPHELRDHPEARPLLRGSGSVAIDRISFGYPGRGQVFDGFSLKIAPSQRVGLVGPSGGGKSTLLALLQRLHDVEAGRILFDGQDIPRVTQQSLHAAIAVVPQDVSLLHRSIFDNIRYGRPEASDEEVFAAAAAARCDAFIEAMPQGMATVVGDRGVKLSGGQRQRLAIARALLKDAPILLLDEATSALDSESEEAIRAALDTLMQGRTVIAVAHRLSTLRNFDRIVVLRQGVIIEDGAPDELMRRQGTYRDLVQRELARLDRRAA